jgi:photosystem II stability/assembly factor-like uncharacterized protein
MRCIAAFLLILALTVAAAPARVAAHSASAYGGMFRSRSMGGAWANADIGLFLSAALTVAVDPRNAEHLLMGTDAGLLASANGGRSWTPEAAGLIGGAVFAVAFAPDGGSALCAAPAGVYRWVGSQWHQSDAPADATPARGIAFSAAAGRVYLLGRDRLFRSNDAGATFDPVAADAGNGGAFVAFAVLRGAAETLFAIAGGELLASTDAGRHWQQRPVTGAAGPLDTITTDPTVPGRLWVAAADRLLLSDDAGATWRAIGAGLPEPHTLVRGIAADAQLATLVVTTHRGTYRSVDGGAHWTLQEGNLPVHLEAGPLARDPADPRTLYAVYSLIPYPEVWRSAVEGSNLLARADRMSLIGGVAFLLLLLLSGGLLVGWLVRRRAATAGRPA